VRALIYITGSFPVAACHHVGRRRETNTKIFVGMDYSQHFYFCPVDVLIAVR